MNFIEALADCIMRFEGWYQAGYINYPRGSNSWRNRNPGNLRPTDNLQPRDDRNYRIFKSLSDGFTELVLDLEAKIIHGSHGITENSTLHDLFSIYAPPLDNNDPQHYSRQVALWLTKIYNSEVSPDGRIGDLMKLGQ